jgi:hypothetical protein
MRTIKFDKKSIKPYEHLDPLVDFLIENGNELSRNYRWGENRTGYFCLLVKPIDFDLIGSEFFLPSYVRLMSDSNAIECDKTWVSVKGGIPRR